MQVQSHNTVHMKMKEKIKVGPKLRLELNIILCYSTPKTRKVHQHHSIWTDRPSVRSGPPQSAVICLTQRNYC